jgi:hypothetical protein
MEVLIGIGVMKAAALGVYVFANSMSNTETSSVGNDAVEQQEQPPTTYTVEAGYIRPNPPTDPRTESTSSYTFYDEKVTKFSLNTKRHVPVVKNEPHREISRW